jgi:hypothetical protein
MVTVELELREFHAEMDRIRSHLSDWTEPINWFWRAWALKVYQAWVMVRRIGGDFRGQQWEGLKEETRMEKEDAVINMDSGQMMRAIMNSTGSGLGFRLGPPTVENKSVLLIGSGLADYMPYAMDKGGRNPLFFKMPEDEELLVATAKKYVEKCISKGRL